MYSAGDKMTTLVGDGSMVDLATQGTGLNMLRG
jgi:hypothetical protein